MIADDAMNDREPSAVLLRQAGSPSIVGGRFWPGGAQVFGADGWYECLASGELSASRSVDLKTA